MDKNLIARLKILVDIQGANGNWNFDPYMVGMFNGMELMMSMVEKREPCYRAIPKALKGA